MTQKALKLALEGVEIHSPNQPEYIVCAALIEALAQPEQEPEFITHSVERPYDWSEWVCPDPKGYLMKCCDCGLVHEAEFGVVRYKSETEREDCDMEDDPNLQAVFRMRRSEQWSPEESVAWRNAALRVGEDLCSVGPFGYYDMTAEEWLDWALSVVTVHSPPPQRTWVGLTDEEYAELAEEFGPFPINQIEAKLKEKNT